MPSERERSGVQVAKVALEKAKGKAIQDWEYLDEGNLIVLQFTDGTILELNITYDREIPGVQNPPYLTAHLGTRKKSSGSA